MIWDFDKMWDKLIELGVSEETLRVVVKINGRTEGTLNDILYAVEGVPSFDQFV